jgi:hypothetical protein
MRSKLLLPVLWVVLCSLLLPCRADDLPIAKFPSECKFETELTVHGVITTAKISIKGNKVRKETTSQGVQSIIIVDGDAQTAHFLNVDKQQSLPIVYSATIMDHLINPRIPKGDVTLVGPDSIDRFQYTKYTIKTKGGKVYSVWLDSQNYLYQIQSDDGTYQFRSANLSGGPVDDSDFVTPSGYTEIPLPKPKDPSGTPVPVPPVPQ